MTDYLQWAIIAALGAAALFLWRDLRYYLEAIAGRGLAIQFRTGKKITASTALTVTTSAAIAHAIDVQGYIQKI